MPYLRVKNELPLIPGKASGDIASFEAAAAPLVSCICTINPVQDLHGQDYPYPAGGGKNKLPTYTGNAQTINGVTFTPQADGSVICNGTANDTITFMGEIGNFQWDGTSDFWLSGCPSGGGSTSYSLRVDGAQGQTGKFSNADTGSGVRLSNGGSVSIANTDIVFTIIIRGQYTCNNLHFYPMLNSGLSAQPYAPYSNICPITGHDYVTITQKDGNNTIVDTTTITFPDTVYGASLDVGTGVLSNNRVYVDLGTLNWSYYEYGDQGGGYANDISTIVKTTPQYGKTTAISDQLNAVTDSGFDNTPNYSFCINSDGMIKVRCFSATDRATLISALSGIHLCYPLKTPTTTQLTPEQLNSILGENNFYHDGNGPIDITYIRRY